MAKKFNYWFSISEIKNKILKHLPENTSDKIVISLNTEDYLLLNSKNKFFVIHHEFVSSENFDNSSKEEMIEKLSLKYEQGLLNYFKNLQIADNCLIFFLYQELYLNDNCAMVDFDIALIKVG